MTRTLMVIFFLLLSTSEAASSEPSWTRTARLDAPMRLVLAPGESITLAGAARTSFDGVTYDAVTRSDESGVRPGGLFQLEGAGLRVIEQHPETHLFKLEATGEEAPACRALGLGSPCLLPRTRELAHERLLTERELAQTMSGTLEISGSRLPFPSRGASALRGPKIWKVASLSVGGGASLLLLACLVFLKRRPSPLRQVQILAREARARTRGDITLAALGGEIDRLVARTEELDRTCRACLARRRWLERTRLHAGSAWGLADRVESERIDRERGRALLELADVAAALRAIALSTPLTHPRPDSDPCASVVAELAAREDALREVEINSP